MAAAGRDFGGSPPPSGLLSSTANWRRTRSTDTCDSCYVTQLAVYVYYDLSDCDVDPFSPPPPSAAQSPPPAAAVQTDVYDNSTYGRIAAAMADAIRAQYNVTGRNESEGYVELTVTYEPYDK